MKFMVVKKIAQKKPTSRSDKSDKNKPVPEINKKKEYDAFANMLASNLGNVSAACRALNVSRQTYYQWKNEFTDFAQRCGDVEEKLKDDAENVMYKAMFKKEDADMIRFYLKTKCRDRGYGTQYEITGPKGTQLNINVNDKSKQLENLTVEELKQLLALSEKMNANPTTR
jgi:hypothetical protein